MYVCKRHAQNKGASISLFVHIKVLYPYVFNFIKIEKKQLQSLKFFPDIISEIIRLLLQYIFERDGDQSAFSLTRKNRYTYSKLIGFVLLLM